MSGNLRLPKSRIGHLCNLKIAQQTTLNGMKDCERDQRGFLWDVTALAKKAVDFFYLKSAANPWQAEPNTHILKTLPTNPIF